MNIPKIAFINKINYNNNNQNKHYSNYNTLPCDTVSFKGEHTKLSYDNVLIYHDSFDRAFKNVSEEQQKNIEKKIEEIKQNNQLTNANHGIEGVPGLYEVTSKGSNGYRIYFKICNGSLVLISCSQKNMANKVVQRIIDKVKDIVISGELEEFVADYQAKESQKDAQSSKPDKIFNQAELDKEIKIKAIREKIEKSKDELNDLCLEPLRQKIREFENMQANYLGDEEQLSAMHQQILDDFTKLEAKIHSLKYENDDENKADAKIKKVSDEVYKRHDALEELLDKAIEFLGKNSICALDAKKERITCIANDIKTTFAEIKAKMKEFSKLPGMDETNLYYSSLIKIQKEYNANVKRKADVLKEFSGQETMSEIDAKLEEALRLDDYALELYTKFEKEIKEYSDSKQNTARQHTRLRPVRPQVKQDEALNLNKAGEVSEQEVVEAIAPLDDAEGIQNKDNLVVTYITSAMPTVKVYNYPKFDMTPYAKQVFETIEDNLAKTMLSPCARDIAIQLIYSIGKEQMDSLNKLGEDEFVNLLNSNMEAISKTPEYQVAIRAMNVAFLNEILLCSKASPDSIYNLPNAQITQLQKEVLSGAKNITLKDEFDRDFQITLEGQPDFDDAETTYRQMTYHLDYETIDALVETISKYASDIPKDELINYLETQGEYLSLINDEATPKALRNRLLKYVFADFDKINNTNFSKIALAQIDKEGIKNRINFFTSDDILETIDL